MDTLSLAGKPYRVDAQGFLTDREDWDEGFAEAMAARSGIPGGLTDRHWDVIRYIRDAFAESGECPLVYSTCRAAGLRLREFKTLFPTGYLRGACRLAGITYRDRFVDFFGEAPARGDTMPTADVAVSREAASKTYEVDLFGFLRDPRQWDEEWAAMKARELKLAGGLTDAHWQVIRTLRRRFDDTGLVPTVIECCEANGLELEELEALFPAGYHREAVKLAGLCVRPS